ncbi:MAG: ABC transporter substrate-binding protein [Candidatus Aquicultorales bacterium]
MKRQITVLVLFALAVVGVIVAGCTEAKKDTETVANKEAVEVSRKTETIILATTTSTKDTGLLDELIPAFEKKTGIKVKTIAVGTGEAIKMGERGEADVLLVHAKKTEEKFMADGYGDKRLAVMYNDFVLVGPASDPAGIKGLTSAKDAFQKIADSGSAFASRSDESGTHKKELSIWESLPVQPGGDWYLKTGSGMAATLRVASEKQAYTLADRGTWLVQKPNLELELLVEKDKPLLNPYSVITLNPDKFKDSKVKFEAGEKFAEWIVSPEAQRMINDFGKDKYPEPLFVGDAK